MGHVYTPPGVGLHNVSLMVEDNNLSINKAHSSKFVILWISVR